MSSENPSRNGFAPALTTWYQAGHRDLPWRNTTNAYHIWLSETMLQQTQVKTVIDYYHRFLERYPSIQALAEAPADDVLKLWEGLGYYARCRNLHKAAKHMVEHHQGQFPQTFAEAQALSGIGRSTAGAILTFAYGQKYPLLDGNVKRVLSRIVDIEGDVQQASVVNRMWQLSEELLSQSDDSYAYNQAIMELGATVCLPKNPRCLLCPVKPYCTAAARGTQHERPVKGVKKVSPHYDIGVGVIWKDGQILIQQRPSEGLLGGLWEFPGGKQEPEESLIETVRREIEEELSIAVQVREPIMTVKHAYTHFKITLHAFHCDYIVGTPEPKACQAWKWVNPEELTTYAFPKANKTVLEKVVQEWQATHSMSKV